MEGDLYFFDWFSHSSNNNWVSFVDQVKLKLLEISICMRKCRDSSLLGNRAISTEINHRTLGAMIEVGWEDERWWHNPLVLGKPRRIKESDTTEQLIWSDLRRMREELVEELMPEASQTGKTSLQTHGGEEQEYENKYASSLTWLRPKAQTWRGWKDKETERRQITESLYSMRSNLDIFLEAIGRNQILWIELWCDWIWFLYSAFWQIFI